MKFKDKVVWITGGSSGIGEALAYAFLNEEAKVIISSNMDDELNRVKENCNKFEHNCFVMPFDLADTDQIRKTANKVIKEFGSVDILINNGGISQRSLVQETPIELDRKIMEINYFGPVALTKSIIPHMINKGGGHIVVTSSISGKFGFPLRSAYSASKHALHGFFETVRSELKNQNINVTIICPGRIKTNISLFALTKDGTPHGKMDEGLDQGVSVEKCAKKYLLAIKKNKKEVYIGSKEILMVYIKRFFPVIFYKIVSKIKPT